MSLRPVLLSLSALLVLSACKENKGDAGASLKAARDFYAQHDYTHALVEARNAIKADPKNGDTHYLTAQILEAQGDMKSAFPEYARAAAPEANNIPAQIKVAEILVSANQLDAALGRINGTLGSRPNDPDVLALRALIEQRQGKSDKARADAQSALLKAPGQPIANAILAATALSEKNPDKALVSVEQGLKAHPTDLNLAQLKASALIMKNDKPAAIALFEDLVKRDPKTAKLRVDLAELYAASNDVGKGEQLLRDGVQAAPDAREMEVGLLGYLDRHRGAAAVQTELRSAIDRSPKDSVFDLLLAQSLARSNHVADALTLLNGTIARVPEGQSRSAARVALARLKLSQGDTAGAKTVLDDAVTAKADDDEALLLRADIELQTDDAARAIPDLLSVQSRQPSKPAPLRLLAEAYLKQGDKEKAVDALKKAVYFDPANITVATRLADIQAQNGQPDAAKQVIADYVKRNPNALDGRAAEMRFAVQRKDWTGAQTALNRLRALPDADKVANRFEAELLEARTLPGQALQAYERAINPADPQHVDQGLIGGLVRSAVAAKQIDAAIAFLSPMVASASGDAAAFLGLNVAGLYRASGQADKADAALDAAIAASPKQPAGYIDRAAAKMRAGQPDQASSALAQGLDAGAPREPLLLARAGIEEQTGKKDAAIASYQEILKLDPRSVVAANNYASLVADAKPTDKSLLTSAREPITRYVGSTNPALLDTIAWLDYRLGDLQSAKDLLVRAKAENSDNAQIRFHYGAVLMAMGDKDAGRTILKATMDKDFPGRAEAERLMTE